MEDLDRTLQVLMYWRGLWRTLDEDLLQTNLPSMILISQTLQFRNRKLHLGSNVGSKRR